MRMVYKVFIGFVVLVIGAFSASLYAVESEGEKLPTREQLLEVSENDLVFGSNEAPVTVIEYASMTCSHCADFHNKAFGAIKEQLIDTGKIRFVYRNFPLNEPAVRAAMMVDCAPQDSKEKFLKVVFKTQDNWASRKNYLEVLSNIAKLGGMNGDDFDACVSDEERFEQITRSRFEGHKVLGVKSTPSFFVNGELYEGNKNVEFFSAFVKKSGQ